MEILKWILPGIVAVIGNVIFYWIIKKRIDKQIEEYKISYSGVFKEKIKVYKTLLEKLYRLKYEIQAFSHNSNLEFGEKIMVKISEFIEYYTINTPFISEKMILNIKKMVSELNSCFDDFYRYIYIRDNKISDKERTNLLGKFFESGDKFKKNHPFKEIEEMIITEMKNDMNID